MLKIFIVFVLFLGIGLLSRATVFADDTATVAATVHTEVVSITTNVSKLDYGLIQYGYDSDLIDSVTITNSGNVAEDFDVKGSDATERTNPSKIWNLVTGSVGVNSFVHDFSLSGSTYTQINKSTFTPVSSNINSGGSTSDIHMKLVAPLAGSYSGTFDTNVYFRATKHT
ncbi:MAG: hypothetical protein NT141_01220 [candidate division WWE3 bacterium]|nr:hypothetical protein [candidate division WWE3 bacterium]